MESEEMIKTGITQGTPQRILFGAGVYFKGATYDEKVAPTEQEIIAGLLGATKDGGTMAITPTFYNPELDGQLVKVAELERKIGEAATIETSFAELTPEIIKNTVIGSVEESTDANYDVITSGELEEGHFYDGFGFYGELTDGRPCIILFKKALCTSGMSFDSKNKEGSVFKGTFECYSDIAYGVQKLPYAIFLYKQDKWQPAKADEVASE